jgi:exodeoxyribonuclease VII large subunit
MADRRRHLVQLARVLPRAETLLAGPRQRLDLAADRLQHSLSRNLQLHGARLAQAAGMLRPRLIGARVAAGRERAAALGARAGRAQDGRLAQKRERLESLARLLEGLSYRGVLERGFALVRAADGTVRRRAAEVLAGEALSLTFADGAVTAGADGGTRAGKAPRARKNPGQDQGSLF